MKILIASLASLAITSPSMAMMSPDFQRAAEIKAVVDAASEVMAGGGETIQAVIFLGEDAYEVLYEHCQLLVDILDTQSDAPMPGARQFQAVAGEPKCGQ